MHSYLSFYYLFLLLGDKSMIQMKFAPILIQSHNFYATFNKP